MCVSVCSVDLDIEGGSPNYYANFIIKLRSLWNSANKKYYVTGAPQCPFPDANLGPVLNNAPFDAVFIQFCKFDHFLRRSGN